MELALYCPLYGYYDKETDNLGRAGDFFTSVSVGELFGELLAFQFSAWLEELRSTETRLTVVESGAHHGQFARDFLTWVRGHREKLLREIQYRIVEPSAVRRKRQQAALEEFGDIVGWTDDLAGGVRGIIFSNELLDAMPVHRLGWDAANQKWFEWGVACERGKFVWEKIREPDSRLRLPELPEELQRRLPDGFTTEIGPAAEAWWRAAAGALERGRLVTIDYGLSAEEFFLPERAGGTLRSYRRHQMSADVLADPGEQDLTAHVNFDVIRAAGESSGLKSEPIVSQETFLNRIAERVCRQPEDFGEWTPARSRQFQTLTHPAHLGRPFRVLVQTRQDRAS